MKSANSSGIGAWIAGHYTRQELWSLFLMCAFPLHAWTLIMAFRDISWLTDRTNAWDAIGVLSYGLLFAFIESLVLFGSMALLGYLVSTHWSRRQRVAVMTTLTLVLCLWAMLEQLFFLTGFKVPGWLIMLLVRSAHPLWGIYAGLGAVVGLTVLIPAWLVLRREGATNAVWGMIDRLSILTAFYILLDIISLVIVIVRNV